MVWNWVGVHCGVEYEEVYWVCVQLVDQVDLFCNVEMDRVTLDSIYSMYKMYHLECKMQDACNNEYT